MQPSSTQPSKPRSEFYKPLHTMQVPGASGDTLSMSTPPRLPPGSVRKNQVAPAPEGPSTSLQKRPWDTIPFVVPRDHFTFTIFAAICCLPLGLIAIYRSTQCRDAVRRGDMKTAKVRSRQAKTLSYWALGFGMLCLFAVVAGFGVFLFSLYRQELRRWLDGPIKPPVHIDRSQDDRPPVTRCCMQS